MTQSILFDVPQSRVGLLTINRPDARNALTWEAMDRFAESVESAARAAELSALIITGSGGAFCSGGDLYELHGYPTHEDGERLSSVMTQALDQLVDLPFPTIAAIEGPALGGGAEIALACDLRVMAEGAKLGMMHIRLGICPAWGGALRLLRQVGYAAALEWLTSGKVLTAAEAVDAGIVNRAVPSGAALASALELAEVLARQDPAAVLAVKRILRAGVKLSAIEAKAAESAAFADLWAAPAHLEASTRFVARRQENHRAR